jgi:hypothetical protein
LLGSDAAPEPKVWMKFVVPVVVGAPSSSRSQWPMLIRSTGTTAWPATVTVSRKGAAGSRLLPTPMTSASSSGCSAPRSQDRKGMRRQLLPGAVP